MTDDPINYFREAFFTAWNYGMLGVLFILGLPMRFNVYYLFFALAVELGLLFTISQNSRFRRAIRARRMADKSLPEATDTIRIQKLLDEDHQSKLRKFTEISLQIKQNAGMADGPRSALLGVSLGKLDSMVNTYLQMLLAHHNYMKYLGQVDRDRIVRQIETIEKEIQGRNDRVSGLKMKNREILMQRLDRIDKARQNIEIVEAELEVMVNTLQLLRDQTISITDPQGISQQIDTVLANMKDTEDLVREMDIFINEENRTDSPGDIRIPVLESENDDRTDARPSRDLVQ
ncbi:hypothetical protein JXA40_03085 [bacterium]|nr:hypothetical protein [candidate division CSSED10-310 bacterium]